VPILKKPGSPETCTRKKARWRGSQIQAGRLLFIAHHLCADKNRWRRGLTNRPPNLRCHPHLRSSRGQEALTTHRPQNPVTLRTSVATLISVAADSESRRNPIQNK